MDGSKRPSISVAVKAQRERWTEHKAEKMK